MPDLSLDLLFSVVRKLVSSHTFASDAEKELHLAALDAAAKHVGAEVVTGLDDLAAKISHVLAELPGAETPDVPPPPAGTTEVPEPANGTEVVSETIPHDSTSGG